MEQLDAVVVRLDNGYVIAVRRVGGVHRPVELPVAVAKPPKLKVKGTVGVKDIDGCTYIPTHRHNNPLARGGVGNRVCAGIIQKCKVGVAITMTNGNT